jgi:hypothetical protein
MKNHINLTLLLITMLGGLVNKVNGDSNCVTNPPDFKKLDYEKANQAVERDQLRQLCSEYVTNLVNQLRGGQLSNDNKVLAIYLLGWLRPTDSTSIQYLIDTVDFKASKLDSKTGLRRWGEYPAQEALMKIGKPTVAPILHYLPQETNELRRQLMCFVIKKVGNTEALFAQINQMLGDELNANRRANLEAAFKELKKP